jgi:ABC-type nitrate/sulfonate/bicarbonate transport system substrate-binding protein
MVDSPPVGRFASQSSVDKLRSIHAAIAAAALSLASAVCLVALQAQPRDRTQVAAVFAPWTNGERAVTRVAQADGRVVRRGIIDAIVVVQGDDPNLVDRLYSVGAWAVIDPDVWGGCLAARRNSAG